MAQFFIRSTRESGEAPLYVKIRRKGFQIYVCTGINVDIQEWEKSQKSMSALKRYEQTPNGEKVHNLQMEVMKAIDTLYAEGKINSKDDKAVIEQTLSSIVNGTTIELQKQVMSSDKKTRCFVLKFYEYFYEGMIDGTIRHGNNSKYTLGTIQVWKNFGKYLHDYCKQDISFDDIDKPFADRFTLYLERKGMMPNTINKNVTCFRKLCNLAAMEGYNKNAVSLKVWKDRTVKEKEKRAEIYLTDEELDALYEMKLTGMEEKVRDIFMLGYFSCQRYSDYSKLREDNFIKYDTGLGIITLTQKKTGNVVNVPIIDNRVEELCRKYNYDFPAVTDQQLNTKIKEITRKLSESVPSLREKYVTVQTSVERRSEATYAKLLKKKKSGKRFTDNERKWFGKLSKLAATHDGDVLFERNKNGDVVRPKYELISSHTSRRSGATNLYKMGVLSSKEMRSITGHQSEKVFEGYIRVGLSEQAQIVADKILAAKKKKAEVEK